MVLSNVTQFHKTQIKNYSTYGAERNYGQGNTYYAPAIVLAERGHNYACRSAGRGLPKSRHGVKYT